MKNFFLFVAVAILAWVTFGSLKRLPSKVTAQPAITPLAQQPLTLERATATPDPSPTLDLPLTIAALYTIADQADASARQAQLDAINARLAEQAAREAAIAADVANKQIELANKELEAGLTLSGAAYTATAFPPIATMAANKLTAVMDARTAIVEDRAAAEQAPMLVQAMAEAQAQAKYADAREVSDILARVVFVAMMVLLIIFIVARWRREVKIASMKLPATGPVIEPKDPRPFVRKETHDNSFLMLPACVPCDLEQLRILAHGVILEGRSLAFGQWEGTIVHRSLKDLRAFAVQHGFAKIVIGTNGELDITDKGLTFLREVLETDALPHPYYFAQNAPEASHDHEITGENLRGGGGFAPELAPEEITQMPDSLAEGLE